MQRSGLSQVRLGRMGDVLRERSGSGQVTGLVALVARHEAVHVDAIGVRDLAFGTPMRRDTLFRIASMTKPSLAMAAMILTEEARVAQDDPVERWLPELKHRRELRELASSLDDAVPADITDSCRRHGGDRVDATSDTWRRRCCNQ